MTRPHDSLGRATVPGPRSASPRPPEPEYPVGKPVRVTAYVLLLVLGAVVGLAGTFVLSLWFPAGLVLSLAAIAALCCGGRLLTGSRTGSAMAALGWFAMLMVAQAPRPEGDFLFAAGVGPYLYLLGGALAAVICATLPQSPPSDRKHT